jgi:peptidoglycan/xylan/chitin deacetylase (PgdA/CDA1 family)
MRLSHNRSSTVSLVATLGALLGALVISGVAASPSLAAARPRVLQVPILMYHRIDALTPRLAPITRRLTVTPADFASEMEWLRRNGFHALTEEQLRAALERGAALPRHPVLITFDDGYRDVLGKAAPVLHRLDLPATAFVITGRISGPDPSFLTWGELRRLEQDGVEIGSHTVTHRELTHLDSGAALHELVAARTVLEAHLHRPVPWLAYPAGAEDARIVALARRAGYALAMTTRPGSRQDGRDPLELRRFEVLDTTGVRGLAALLRTSSSRSVAR